LATTDKWELSTHESLHQEVIKKCPDTKKAQESCWKLSTLYTYGFEPVEHEKIIEVLELFCSRYEQSPLQGEVYDRLLHSYQETGRNDKVIELLATRLFKQELSDDDFVNYALALSQAYEDNGQFDAARMVYQEILKRDDGRTYASVVAQRQLEN
jgi:tetratricopeptide (TPR) repeat protein